MNGVDPASPKPLYRQIMTIIQDQIGKGQFKTGEKLCTERELSRKYKVSKLTVNKALDELVRDKLLYRRRGRGTFVAPGASDRVEPEEQKVLHFIVPDIEDIFISEIYRGVGKLSKRNNYKVAIFSSDRSIQKENENIRFLLKQDGIGAIILPNWGKTNIGEIFKLKQEKIPFVLIDRYFPDIETDYVIVDNVAGASNAVRHLINLGHRRIGHIGGMNCSSDNDRLEGYRLALSKAGIPYAPFLVKRISEFTEEQKGRFEPDELGGYKGMKELLKLDDRPTAIFAGSDYIAIGALRAIKEADLNVPNDAALVSFDDLKIASMLEVPLTTVRQPKYEIGKTATEILMKRFKARDIGEEIEPQQIVLKTELIIRESCGAKKSAIIEA